MKVLQLSDYNMTEEQFDEILKKQPYTPHSIEVFIFKQIKMMDFPQISDQQILDNITLPYKIDPEWVKQYEEIFTVEQIKEIRKGIQDISFLTYLPCGKIYEAV